MRSPGTGLADAAGRSRRPEPGGRCTDLRCGCGSLLARRVEAAIELKCRRCKRTILVPLPER